MKKTVYVNTVGGQLYDSLAKGAINDYMTLWAVVLDIKPHHTKIINHRPIKINYAHKDNVDAHINICRNKRVIHGQYALDESFRV